MPFAASAAALSGSAQSQGDKIQQCDECRHTDKNKNPIPLAPPVQLFAAHLGVVCVFARRFNIRCVIKPRIKKRPLVRFFVVNRFLFHWVLIKLRSGVEDDESFRFVRASNADAQTFNGTNNNRFIFCNEFTVGKHIVTFSVDECSTARPQRSERNPLFAD